ncbi:precorrin-8X methylmutase [Calidifontibacter terrae]
MNPPQRRYDYLTDGAEIYRRSFATIRERTDLRGFAAGVEPVVARVIHAAGDPELVGSVAAAPDVVAAASNALRSGATIFTDSVMLASGITRARLPADNEVVCLLRDPRVPALAAQWGTTRAAAAVSLWGEQLEGAVVAIGNAPTALFHLLEWIHDGGPRPAAIVGIPVGFVGSAESKVALAEHRLADGRVIPWFTVHGHRGGSAMAAAAVNALASRSEI